MKRVCVTIESLFICAVSVLCANADLYKRAPDTLPGTLPGMRNPSYWIERMEKPDEIILTIETIEQMNRAYEDKMRLPDPFKDVEQDRKPNMKRVMERAGRVLSIPDIHTMNSQDIAVIVKNEIQKEIEYLRSRKFGNANALEYAEWQIDAFENEMALHRVGEKITPQNAITVRHTRLQIIPADFYDDQGLIDSGKTLWNLWNLDILRIARPVTILHPSQSGMYLFVLSNEGYGWIRSVDVAFCNEKENARFTQSKTFLVCADDIVPFYTDKQCKYASGRLRMGDRIPLVNTNKPYKIKVPVRKTNGTLAIEEAFIKENAFVHAGWLPYTRRNIVETAFRLLDNQYDWTGAWFGRNHETTYRDIFACFGFRLPYHGILFTHFGDTKTVVQPDIGIKKQKEELLKHEPFVTIQNCGGHCQLLLGEYNGEPIVFDQHGYGYQLEDDTWLEVRRCCIGDMRMPSYFLKNKIMFLELR